MNNNFNEFSCSEQLTKVSSVTLCCLLKKSGIDLNIYSFKAMSLNTNERVYLYLISTLRQTGIDSGNVRGVIKNYGIKWSFNDLSSDS